MSFEDIMKAREANSYIDKTIPQLELEIRILEERIKKQKLIQRIEELKSELSNGDFKYKLVFPQQKHLY